MQVYRVCLLCHGTTECILNTFACPSLQHLHGSSRSLVRRIGSSLPIDTGRRLYVRVGTHTQYYTYRMHELDNKCSIYSICISAFIILFKVWSVTWCFGSYMQMGSLRTQAPSFMLLILLKNESKIVFQQKKNDYIAWVPMPSKQVLFLLQEHSIYCIYIMSGFASLYYLLSRFSSKPVPRAVQPTFTLTLAKCVYNTGTFTCFVGLNTVMSYGHCRAFIYHVSVTRFCVCSMCIMSVPFGETTNNVLYSKGEWKVYLYRLITS